MTRPKSAARTRSSPSRARALRRRRRRQKTSPSPRSQGGCQPSASGGGRLGRRIERPRLALRRAARTPRVRPSEQHVERGVRIARREEQNGGAPDGRERPREARRHHRHSAQRPRFHPLDEDEDVRERGDPRAQRHAAQIHVNHRAKPVVRARPPRRSALPRRQQPAPESHQNLGALSQGISSCVNCHGEGPASTANHRRTVKSQKTPVCLPVRIFANFAIFGVGPKQTGRRRDCQRGQGGCREVVGRLLGSKEVLQVEVVWCRRFGCHRERRVLRG